MVGWVCTWLFTEVSCTTFMSSQIYLILMQTVQKNRTELSSKEHSPLQDLFTAM